MPKTDDVIAGMTQAIIDIMEKEPDNWTKPWAGVSGMERFILVVTYSRS